MSTYLPFKASLAKSLNRFLNMTAVVVALNKEKAPVGAFSAVIAKVRLQL